MPMGHDQHGPTDPGEPPHPVFDDHEPANVKPFHEKIAHVNRYRCPICNGGENRYLTCDYPGCPDGRDPGHPHARLCAKYDPIYDPYRTTPQGERIRMVMGWVFFVVLLLYLFFAPAR